MIFKFLEPGADSIAPARSCFALDCHVRGVVGSRQHGGSVCQQTNKQMPRRLSALVTPIGDAEPTEAIPELDHGKDFSKSVFFEFWCLTPPGLFVCFVHLPPRFYTHWFFVWKLDNPRIFPRKGQTVDLGPRRVWHVTAGGVCLFSRCWYRLVARCLSTFGCCMVWVRQPECRLWGADVERAPWGGLGSGRRLALWTGRLASFFGSWCCAR